MKRRCNLNGMSMRNMRDDKVYQAVLIDLALTGAIDRSVAEGLLGAPIPKSIDVPGWYAAAATESDRRETVTMREADDSSADE